MESDLVIHPADTSLPLKPGKKKEEFYLSFGITVNTILFDITVNDIIYPK